nr:intraflagellar transport protein 43 homolog isoform X3 [Dermacentor andersoni]
MDADELDDLESPVKKTFGSRARRLNIFGNNTTDIPTNAFASNGSGEGSKAPPKPRRNSGWAEDNSSSGLFRFRRSSARPPSTVPIEASKLTRNETVLERDDSDSEIPSIPDLGEVEYDDLATQVAQAPRKNATHREATSFAVEHCHRNLRIRCQTNSKMFSTIKYLCMKMVPILQCQGKCK